MNTFYIFIKKETGLTFYCTTFAKNCSDALWKEFNENRLRNQYGHGIMFASLKSDPKIVTRFSRSF